MTYSVHTIELSCTISLHEYNALKEKLHLLAPSIETHEPYKSKDKKLLIYETIYRKLHIAGINCIKLKKITVKKTSAILSIHLYITVNLANILSQKTCVTTDIITPDKIDSAVNQLQYTLQNLVKNEIADRIALNRVDFCCDLKMPSQKMAEEYLQLLRRGNPSKTLKEKKMLDQSQHRYIPYKDSFLLQCKSYEFQIYLKYNQMKNTCYSQNIDYALGLLRFELRAKKTKIQQLSKKYNHKSRPVGFREFLNSAPLIAQTEIPAIIAKMVGTSNFCTYQAAKEKIEEADLKYKTRKRMFYILDYYAKHTKYQNLLKDLGLSRKEWNHLLKKFNMIHTNPITISRTYQRQEYPGIYYWDTLAEL